MEQVYSLDKPAVIKDWVKSVREGAFVSVGNVILTCEEISEGGDGSKPKLLRIKSTSGGVVQKLLAVKGDVVKKGTPLLLLGPCTHPTVMKDMCAECGQDLRKLDEPNPTSASVSMVHSVPELRVSMEQAQRLGKVDEDRLLDKRKLVLLVDLDQTLIHTTNDIVPNNVKDVFHFQLWGHGSVWYHTRIRPHTREFLETISQLYELHICTFGTRHYAISIAHQLDPLKKLFSDRILSRDECFSQNSKTANLKELFPRGDHMVCIIDDREDVWNFAPNLIHVKPYHFFRHTGDINAPPGLTKKDQDDKTGVQFDGDKVDSGPATKESSQDDSKPQEEEEPSSTTTTSKLKEVATDLNLSEDDDSENDSGKEEAAQDADMEDSNDDDMMKKTTSHEVSSSQEVTQSKLSEEAKEPPLEESPNGEPEIGSSQGPSEDLKSESATVKPAESATVKPESEDAPDSTSGATEKSDAPAGPEPQKLVEVEDADDYLLYLEQILKSIHQAYYSLYDDMVKKKEGGVPDVKSVIPYVRQKIMKGKNVSIVFSGVVPTHVPLNKSKAYQIAVGLGAHVSDKLIPPHKPGSSGNTEPPTTHVVAARMGTAKVNEARRYKGIHVVTPEWLWMCAERWEYVEENLFRLDKAKNVKRNPPPHCSSPSEFRREKFEILTPIDGPDDQKPSTSKGGQPAMRKERTPSGRFMDTINPLLSFSAGEIAAMSHEVDDDSSTSEDEEELQQKERERAARRRSSRSLSGQDHETLEDPSTSELTKGSLSSSSSGSDSNSSDESDDDPFGSRDDRPSSKKRKRESRTETEGTEDEPLSVKFRRGEPLPSDIDSLNLMNPSTDDDDDGEEEANEEDEWMAQALEREFLDENSRSEDGFELRR